MTAAVATAGAPAPAPTGTVHDLGYKRYVGTRRSTATRWQVIARHQLATAWKTWWRFKAALGAAVLTTFVAGGFLYFAHDRIFRALGRGGIVATFADGILPMSIAWYCKIGFLVSLTIGAGVIAGDVQSGAFTSYFARSVRPRDYVAGKIAGMIVLLSMIMLAGPVVLALLRLGLSENTEQLVASLSVVPKAIAVGALGTIAYAVVPLGFSALVPNRRSALALWAAYYLVVGTLAAHLGSATSGSIGAIDLASSLTSVSLRLFDLQLTRGVADSVPMTAALISIGAHVAIAIAIVAYKVRAAHLSGIGGSS